MKRNYYEILEIDKKASPEVIKKAYNTLVKKYHPDLQSEDTKHIYEEKIKLINEAYEVLSNEEKRKQYDIELSSAELENDKLTDELLNENNYLKQELNRIKNNTPRTNSSNSFNNIKSDYQNQIQYEYELQQAREKAYYDAYIQDLKNRGYKIKYKKTFKEHLKNIIALFLTIIIFLIIFQIPFVKKFFVEIYEENIIIQNIVKLFAKIFNIKL